MHEEAKVVKVVEDWGRWVGRFDDRGGGAGRDSATAQAYMLGRLSSASLMIF